MPHYRRTGPIEQQNTAQIVATMIAFLLIGGTISFTSGVFAYRNPTPVGFALSGLMALGPVAIVTTVWYSSIRELVSRWRRNHRLDKD